MALIHRMSRMMRADLNAVLDRIEEPELLLRQAVREMEEELAQAEHRLARLAAEGEQIEGRIRQLDSALGRIDEELDLCFESDKDDLARAMVRRKLESDQLMAVLQRRGEEVATARETERSRLQENRLRYESMRQKAELLAEEAMSPADEPETGSGGAVRDEEVEVAFLREQKRRAK